MATWCLWSRCNALKFSHLVQPIDSISPKAGNLLQEFLSAQDNNTPLLPLLQFPSGSLLLQISLKLTLMQWCSSLLTLWALG